MRLSPFMLALSLLVFPRIPAAQGAVVLTRDGAPAATIVIAANASDQAREAATELQHYLTRISGAVLPIVSEDRPIAGTRILVGRSEAVAALGVDLPSGHTRQMNEEGFLVRTTGDTLILAGNEDWDYRGTIFAVYDFLDQLGCRWYFPGDFGELLPSITSITVPDTDRLERPDFRLRDIWYSGWTPATEEERKDFQKWYVRNKLTRLTLSLPEDGSLNTLVPKEKYL